jgi:hypothetical protein
MVTLRYTCAAYVWLALGCALLLCVWLDYVVK